MREVLAPPVNQNPGSEPSSGLSSCFVHASQCWHSGSQSAANQLLQVPVSRALRIPILTGPTGNRFWYCPPHLRRASKSRSRLSSISASTLRVKTTKLRRERSFGSDLLASIAWSQCRASGRQYDSGRPQSSRVQAVLQVVARHRVGMASQQLPQPIRSLR